MICKNCGSKNEKGALFCSVCGASFAPQKLEAKSRKKKLAATLAAVAVLAVAGLASLPFIYLHSFESYAETFAGLAQIYALGEYEEAYKTLDEQGGELLKSYSFMEIPQVKAEMKQLEDGIVAWNEQNAARLGQELPKFQALEKDCVLGNYEAEYQDTLKQASRYAASADYIGISSILEPMRSLSGLIQALNERVAEFKAVYDQTAKAFELLYLDDAQQAEYASYLGELEQALEAFDTSACEAASIQLSDYQDQIEGQNISELEELIEVLEDFDEELLLDAEVEAYTSYIKKAEDGYAQKNYAMAYENYSFCLEQVERIEDSWQYGMELEQVDISEYPKVSLYLSIRDLTDDSYVDELDADSFLLMEAVGSSGDYQQTDILSTVKMDGKEKLNIAMVADCSASMSDDFYYGQDIMDSFLNRMQTDVGDRAALYSFADQVEREMYFTSDVSALTDAVYEMEMGNMTALYDALAFSLSEIVVQDGAKCVIAFTDGAENCSTSSKDFVIQKANEYHIPIYLIGIGTYVDDGELWDIAESTGGFYVNINDIGYMDSIYDQVYQEQKSMYVVQYNTDSEKANEAARKLYICYQDEDHVIRAQEEYIPAEYKINGFIFYDSDKRYLKESELDSLTEAEVRIALNEIYARRGYKFSKSPDMIQHFNNCSWYRGTQESMEAAAAFFNDFERKNVDLLVKYECKHGLNGRVQ